MFGLYDWITVHWYIAEYSDRAPGYLGLHTDVHLIHGCGLTSKGLSNASLHAALFHLHHMERDASVASFTSQ